MSKPGLENPARRRLTLAAGALVLSFSLRPRDALPQPKAGKPAAPGLPGSLKKEPLLDAWIRIAADGGVTVFTGKAELGQGIKTALLQVAAEELVVPPGRITLVTADTARTPNEGYTAGSHSMQDSGTAIRHAAAQVREILVGLAAQRLNTPAELLRVAGGAIEGAGRRIGYGELVSGRELHVEASGQAPLRAPGTHRVIGKPLQRLDIPAKVTGGAAYVHDLRPPGMVHGRIVRPPNPAATLDAVDVAPVTRLPGVLKVVRDGRFLAVIAEREYQAVKAAAALAAAARWREQPILPVQADLYRTVLQARTEDTVILQQGTGGAPGRRLQATYRKPFQLHASIGPSCAIAQNLGGQYTVWTHSQGVYPLRAALAEMLGVAEETIRCVHAEGAGCYGHNGADDVAADAALLARALPERPVRVQWMREDEHGWEPLGPPMVVHAAATLDPAGRIADWDYEVWSPPHNTRPGAAGNLLAATHLAQPFAPPPPKPIPQPEGGGDRNAIPLYTLPNACITHHFVPQAPLRVSALRSLGAYCNVFAVESFMDELARTAKADPIAFRLRHLQDPRARDVVRLAADRFGWDRYRRMPRRGRGFAFARYKNLGAFAAVALEVEVARDTGLVRITRALVAVDAGEIVNPDGIRNQIEGGLLQSASWTLCEEASFSPTGVTSRDWGGYPILRFPQMPERVEVHLVERPGQPFLGTGEAAQGPVAAAIANAFADATGVRLRDLPLNRPRVRAALVAMKP
jgi:nicotinate dehydrogenase subunit B